MRDGAVGGGGLAAGAGLSAGSAGGLGVSLASIRAGGAVFSSGLGCWWNKISP